MGPGSRPGAIPILCQPPLFPYSNPMENPDTPPPEGPARRGRGAPRGNQNARKHGFYAKNMTVDQLDSLDQALEMEDLKQEIALMRVKLATLLGNPDTPPDLVFKAVRMLSRMIEIQQRFYHM